MKKLFFISILIISFQTSCQQNKASEENKVVQKKASDSLQVEEIEEEIVEKTYEPIENRDQILEQISAKKEKGLPLVVHLYIPLCDNDNQGIVPTTASLGNGMNLNTNLYWATGSATKSYFKKHKDWKLIYDEKDIDTNVLERIIFERNYGGTQVYLVADAYRGDRMEETVNNFLAALSNNRHDTILVDSSTQVFAAGNADLIMFNGHNGMMDPIHVKEWKNTTQKQTDAVMNACVTFDYFSEELINAGAYPLVRTQSLLHPGAYVLTQIIDDWVNGVEEKQLCLNAGRAYCKKHSCGTGTKVYRAGW